MSISQPVKKADPASGKNSSSSHAFSGLPMMANHSLSTDGPTHPVSLIEAQAAEKRTTGQAASKEWKDLHQFTITSSNFRRISQCSSDNARENLLKSLFDGKDLSDVASLKHGKDHEAIALSQYVQGMSEQGKSLAVRSCGLVLDTSHRYLGASPDAIVFDLTSCPRYGLVEIKCHLAYFSPFIQPRHSLSFC